MGFFDGNGFDIMFGLIFLLVIVIFVFTIIKGIVQWNRNNNSPRRTVDATVVSKRIDVTRHKHAVLGDITGAHGYHTTSNSQHCVTFEVNSGDRIEMHVSVSEYRMLVEGEHGKLTFQGTRYIGFEK